MRVRGLAGRAYALLLVFGATLLAGAEAMYCGDRNCYDVLKYVTVLFVTLTYESIIAMLLVWNVPVLWTVWDQILCSWCSTG